MTEVTIRDYRAGDAAATLRVFIEAITVTASADYSPEQITAWARPEQRHLDDWDRSMSARSGFVALVRGVVAGFSDVSGDGHVDMMFVSPASSGRGVGRALMREIEARARRAGTPRLWADVSITARGFFEHAGFSVQVVQHPVIGGVRMTNFRMVKTLA
ncbi:GNAT family N-acetyltransferase [Microbacterium sp.]|uniref:GNAT family N-acetyltransferase n=1 Tax=Microbacterium sp. TaxID=51671 RepID=UPI002811B4A9|nr:GNAT family N-acetyltransferase [Microbacterium sp.]